MLVCSVTADTDNEYYKLCHFDIKDCQEPRAGCRFPLEKEVTTVTGL